jgi:hypothetical protein
MRINGVWRLCDDGITRPTFWGEIVGASGHWVEIPFTADCGADRTVLSSDAFRALAFDPVRGGQAMVGVGGKSESLEFRSVLRMCRSDGVMVHFRGDFAAGADDDFDMSVLGRDITNHFALVIDRPQDTVCLLYNGEVYQA